MYPWFDIYTIKGEKKEYIIPVLTYPTNKVGSTANTWLFSYSQKLELIKSIGAYEGENLFKISSSKYLGDNKIEIAFEAVDKPIVMEISNALQLSEENLSEIIDETNMSVTCITQCIEDNDYLYFDCIVNTFDRKVSFAIYFKCSISNDDILINEVSSKSFQ